MDRDSVTIGRMPDPGDCASVRDMYDACHGRLVVSLCGVTGDLDEAEEAVREAFVRAVTAGSRVWRVEDPEAWLRATAIHAHRRARRRRRAGAPPAGRPPGTPARTLSPGSEAAAPEPAFDLIEAAGNARRRRRHAVTGARVTVPTGWSAWPGNVALFREDPDWHVGLLVAAVTATARPGCTTRDTSDRGPASLLRALTHVPRLAVVSGPHRAVHDGRPETRLRLRELGRQLSCPDAALFETSHGYVDGGAGGDTYEARIVAVDGDPLLVWAGWTRHAPHAAVQALRDVVDSLVLRVPGRP